MWLTCLTNIMFPLIPPDLLRPFIHFIKTTLNGQSLTSRDPVLSSILFQVGKVGITSLANLQFSKFKQLNPLISPVPPLPQVFLWGGGGLFLPEGTNMQTLLIAPVEELLLSVVKTIITIMNIMLFMIPNVHTELANVFFFFSFFLTGCKGAYSRPNCW